MYTFGVVVLLITSIPAVIHKGGSLPGLLVALLTIGAALGGTKAVIPPLLGTFSFDREVQLFRHNPGKEELHR